MRKRISGSGPPLRFFSLLITAVVALALAACGGTSAGVAEATEAEPAVTEAAHTATKTQASKSKATKAKTYKVARVIDGDTLELGNGKRVRLVQIDSPETQEDECFSEDATAVLSAILPKGTKVTLKGDPKLDDIDRYDRLLRYVFKGKKDVNLVLVRRGAASVWFYEGDRGRHAKQLLRAAKRAKSSGRGLWGACPGTRLDALHEVQTSVAVVESDSQQTVLPAETEEPPATTESSSNCHSSYEGACLDPSISDYDCEGGSGNGPGYTGTVRVVGPDDYGLDGDGDGFGCE